MAAEATPEAGFADGDGDFARFDGPSGLAAAEDGTLFVADTNNHLVSSSTGCSCSTENTLVGCTADRYRGPPGASLSDKQAPLLQASHPLAEHPNETNSHIRGEKLPSETWGTNKQDSNMSFAQATGPQRRKNIERNPMCS